MWSSGPNGGRRGRPRARRLVGRTDRRTENARTGGHGPGGAGCVGLREGGGGCDRELRWAEGTGTGGTGSGPQGWLAAGPGGRLARSWSPRWRPGAQSAFVPPARPVRAGWSRPLPKSLRRSVRSGAALDSVNKPSLAGPPGSALPEGQPVTKGSPDPRVRRFSPAHRQEHGSHPLQRLARGHPRLLPA